MSQPATTSTFGIAASAAAWLYGIAVPSTGSDAGSGGSVAIQLRPMIAVRWSVNVVLPKYVAAFETRASRPGALSVQPEQPRGVVVVDRVLLVVGDPCVLIGSE